MRLSRLPLYASLCALALPAALAAQNGAAVRALTKPDAEFEEGFTQIAGVRELSDGRVIVIDPREKVVRLLDFASGNMAQIGREGSGPNEYAMPMTLLALPGDSSLVYDPLNQRFLLIDPKGKPAGTFSLAQEAAAAPPGPRGGMVMRGIGGRLKGVDRQGRLYFLASNFMMSPDGQPQRADSAPITRYDRNRKKTDTVTYVKMPQMNVQMSGRPTSGAAPTRIAITSTVGPYEVQDDWAVTPDGRIAVVRGERYRVDWINANGARTTGPDIPFERIKITEADKRAWKESRSRMTGNMTMRIGGPGGARETETRPVNPRDIPDPTDWPDFKPPFTANAVTMATDGMVWVQRTEPAGAKGTLYDIIDGRGQVVGRVRFPERTRLVGFGKGVAYTVRLDEDDLQYLQRFKL